MATVANNHFLLNELYDAILQGAPPNEAVAVLDLNPEDDDVKDCVRRAGLQLLIELSKETLKEAKGYMVEETVYTSSSTDIIQTTKTRYIPPNLKAKRLLIDQLAGYSMGLVQEQEHTLEEQTNHLLSTASNVFQKLIGVSEDAIDPKDEDTGDA